MSRKKNEALKQRIAVFETYSLDLAYGNQRFLKALFKYIDKSKFRTYMIAPLDSSFLRDIIDYSIKTIVLPAPVQLNKFGGSIISSGIAEKLKVLIALISYNYKFAKVLHSNKIRTVQVQNLRGLLMVGIGSRMVGADVIWYIKGHLDNPFLDRIAFRIATKVIFQSRVNRDRQYPGLIDKFKDKTSIVQNGLDFERFENLQTDTNAIHSELNISPSKNNILFLGQISPLKGVDYLIRAFHKLEDKDSVLYLAGNDSIKEHKSFFNSLKLYVKQNKLHNIHFLGFREDALSILAAVDIFVLPSLSEGVPRSIMESMFLGKPVIATDVGGISEMIQDKKTGFLISPCDTDGLALTLSLLTNDHHRRQEIGLNGREHAIANFDIKKVIKRLQSHY